MKGRSILLAGALSTGALGAPGCGPDEVVETPDLAPVEPVEQPSRIESRRDHFLYDEEGNLRESEEVIAGLVMPRGLELSHEEERRHVYSTSVPRPKLLAYFGPRLFTGSVDRIGEGAIFRAATVQGVRGGQVRLDVSILETGPSTRVEVFEIPPLPENPPSPEEIEEQYREMMQRGE